MYFHSMYILHNILPWKKNKVLVVFTVCPIDIEPTSRPDISGQNQSVSRFESHNLWDMASYLSQFLLKNINNQNYNDKFSLLSQVALKVLWCVCCICAGCLYRKGNSVRPKTTGKMQSGCKEWDQQKRIMQPKCTKKTVKSIGRGFWLSDCSARLFSEYIVELE